ncbi:MAG TPA: DUF881 domain-containing protein [Propionibacteriaceae bacterium]|nr:DUF881 domain-containing protein [Propionibacteriaceae bacterium]HPZ50574.1 DUF881 domain-containing protein [Propionibacteriaceae bacterium]
MAVRRGFLDRVRRVLVRAWLRDRAHPRTAGNRALTVVALIVAAALVTSAAVAARGQDLRPNRNTDMIALVRQQAERNADLTEHVAAVRAEVDQLTKQAPQQSPQRAEELAQLGSATNLTPVTGPAVTVTLTDAPLDVKPEGVSEDSLIVHQQDIQAVVNALWAGGAEAMTIQGQRVTTRTGVKCVGNVIVLHGTPYAPPYVVTAIGDQRRLEAALASSPYLTIYRQYADKYGLGYAQKRAAEVKMDGYKGPVDLTYAKPLPS